MFKELFYTLCIAIAAILFNIFGEHGVSLTTNVDTVEIVSSFGRLRGKIGKTRSNREIYRFTSIPYAKPPVGNLRFEPPVKYGKWKGILDATIKPPRCAQVDFILQTFMGQEDCLYLNVYTPTLNKKELLPVMVFIYGGIFMFGSTEYYGPEYLLDEDVILVTMNYRTNVLGFLNTEDRTVTGNQGLKDQSMALSWVREAIRDFGGDSNKVTIFGNSAGAASVHFHILSKMSEGLFQRAISQSGTALCSWTFNQYPRQNAVRFASMAGCPTDNSQEVVQCLKGKTTKELMGLHYETLDLLHEKEAMFAPSVEYISNETDVDGRNTFLSESPLKLLQEGRFNKVPWITGVTKDEGCYKTPLIVSDTLMLHKLNHDWTLTIEKLLKLYTNIEETSDRVREEYFPEIEKTEEKVVADGKNGNIQKENESFPFRMITREDLENITNLLSDRDFTSCSKDASIYHSQHAPLYSYFFNKIPDLGYGYILESSRAMKILPVNLRLVFAYIKFLIYRQFLGWKSDEYGVCHTDELQQLFRLSPELEIHEGNPHFALSQQMARVWVSFAKNGEPDSFFGIEWKQVNKDDEYQFLEISDSPRMINDPFLSRLEFWKNLNLQ